MARNYFLIISTVFLIVSCAQIGTISGGEKDIHSPVPDMIHSIPPNESVLFTGKRIEIPFNEFFTIQNPTSSIRMVPPHATIHSSFKGKKLILEWDEDLKANTTYSIYLDKAIRDITEGNDSLIQFVFSTGTYIDTGSYSGMVIDAYTHDPTDDVYVVLRNPVDSGIVSYARSDKSGNFALNYLPTGTFDLVLIQESIKDFKVGPAEAVAFKENGDIQIEGNTIDTIPFLLSTPVSKRQFTTAEYVEFGMLNISANYPIEKDSFSFDEFEPSQIKVKPVEPDSLLLFLPMELESAGKHVLKNHSNEDSISVRITHSEKKSGTITSVTKENKVFPSTGIHLEFNDLIKTIDTAHIHLFNALDSSELQIRELHVEFNDVYITPKGDDVQKVLVMIDSATVQGTHVSNSLYEGLFTLLKLRELGTIHLDLTPFSSALILDVLKDNKAVQHLYISDPSKKITLSELMPGTYSFRIIEDINTNGIWDSCDYFNKTQAERVSYFSPDNKLRGNWEIDLQLVPVE